MRTKIYHVSASRITRGKREYGWKQVQKPCTMLVTESAVLIAILFTEEGRQIHHSTTVIRSTKNYLDFLVVTSVEVRGKGTTDAVGIRRII